MEPTSTTAAAGFAMSKVWYGLSALFTGMVIMFLRNKPSLRNHSRAASGAIVGGVSAGSGIIFGGALAVYLGLDPNDANVALAVGGFIGLVAFGSITLVANFYDKREGQDVLEVAMEVKDAVTKKRPATKRPAAKKAPRK